MNPDPLLFSPDDAAWQMEVIGLDHQREAFGNADGGGHLKCGAGFGKIADRAIEGGAAKRNFARLQKPPPWCCSVLVHHMDLRLNREVFGQ